MYPSRWKDPVERSKRDALVVEMGNWVRSLATWEDYATLTFAKEYSVDGVAKRVEKFMASRLPGCSYFYAVEANPDFFGNNPGAHSHMLLNGLKVQRKQVWAEWFELYGINRILPIVGRRETVMVVAEDGVPCVPYPRDNYDGGMTVADYCAKYVCKNGAWWNVHLQPWLMNREPAALVLHV
jgi:hypothetical protein